MSRLLVGALLLSILMAASGCQRDDPSPVSAPRGTSTPSPIRPTADSKSTPVPAPPRSINRWVTRRPAWLGKRVLPIGSYGFGVVRPTPRILRNRRLATIDLFPRPKARRFVATISPVPRSVVARSSWRPKCPVSLDELAYVKMSFWGFDHLAHTGEMLLNAAVAEDVVSVFRKLYRARFAIEEMRVVTMKEVREWHTAPTGDTNVTSSFECRQATLGSTWSMHAYGLALDINPFHNPYARGSLVAPELASAYVDREWKRPGMIFEGDAVTQAFDAIGWGWGGRWSSLKDWMHFSTNGR